MFDFVDHFVYATPDLKASTEALAELFGVKPERGGAHVNVGTANTLLALGGTTYFEIIGPNLDQPEPPHPRPFGIDELKEPRLVTWASGSSDLEKQRGDALAAGFEPGMFREMSRRKPDGSLLSWKQVIGPWQGPIQPIPFLIDWGGEKSPGASLPVQMNVEGFTITHPDADEVNKGLSALGLLIRAEEGAEAELLIQLSTPRGTVELR